MEDIFNMSSATQSIQMKYQGFESSRNKGERLFKQTFIGSESLIDQKINTLVYGSFHENKGYLTKWRKTQDDGIFYQLEIQYTISYDNDPSSLDDTQYGKKSASLSVRNIQMPLQHLPNYLTNWNYYLIGLTDSVPEWWETAKDFIISPEDRKNYMWIKSLAELPLQPNEEQKYWQIIKKPTKPGVQYYDLACFVVTETSKHNSANSAANSISKKINTITSPDEDFGITGGNWKLDQCSIAYSGEYWLATKVYTRSGDDNGWDTDLYGSSN